MSITFDDLKNGNYSFRTYWNDIQQLLGYGPKVDPTTLETDQLVTLGKAVRAEFERVKTGSSMGLGDVSFAMVLQDIEAEQDKATFESIKDKVEPLNQTIKNIGYSLQYGVGVSGREMYAEMYDEMAYQSEQVQKIISELDPDHRDVWTPYAQTSLIVAQCWRGDDHRLGSWLHELQRDFQKRQPGYVEPEVIEWNSDDWDDSDFPEEPDIPEHEFNLMMMEEQLREMDHSSTIDNIRYQRLQRTSKEQTLWSYQDQLDGLMDEVNVKFKQGLARLEKANLQPGDEVELYFNGRHPGMSLLKRYGESLGSAPKWWSIIERHIRGNTYRVHRKDKPDKSYLLTILIDDRGHFYCPTFMSEWGKIWADKELEFKPNNADWYKMSEAEIITFHRSLDHWFRDKEKKGQRN